MMAKRFLSGLLLLVLVLGAVGCGAAGGGSEVPKKLVVGFAPSTEAQKISAKVEPLRVFLEKELGIPVEMKVPTDYIGLAEAMGSRQVDIGFLNPAAYALANSEFGVKVFAKAVRKDPKTGQDTTTYNAQLIAHKDAGIQSFKDIKGKRVAFTDPASTSGYLYPVHYLMTKEGVKDLNAVFAKYTFLTGHDAVVKAVYNREYDAGFTFVDARTRVAKELKDVNEKVLVVAEIPGIPNDTISARKELSADFIAKFKAAMQKFLGTDEGKKVMFDLYQWTGMADAVHNDYQPVIDVVKATRINLREVMAPTKK